MKKVVSFLLCFVLVLAIIPAGHFSAATEKERPSYLFAIDAGHGGDPKVHFDPGSTRCDGKYECYDTEKLANEVIKLLKQQGQRTVLINRNLVTHDRPIEANKKNADFLISLHRDSSTSSKARGISVYTHEPSHKQRKEQPKKDYAPAEHKNKHKLDKKLVNNLKTCLDGATTMPFRGIYYGSASAPTWEDYYINRLSNMPSCIIEMGFGTNKDDNTVFDKKYKTLAAAVVKALLMTVDLDYVGPFSTKGQAICQSQDEWYYVVDGVVNWSYTGKVVVDNKTYLIQNGFVTNVASGKTGKCDWKLDISQLTVSGKGAMGDYSTSSTSPWGDIPVTAELKSGVTKIGKYAFYDSSALTQISIPKTVVQIGENAFEGCTALEQVLYYGTKSEWDQIAISGGNTVLDTVSILYICDINGHQYDFVCDSQCNVCGETRDVTHTYSSVCDISCDVCGERRETIHTYSADCDMICDICGYIRKTEVAHIFGDDEICTVCGSRKYIPGDTNNDYQVTDADAVYLLMNTFFEEEYPVNQPCDFNQDGIVTDADAVYLLMYTFFPEDYPI